MSKEEKNLNDYIIVINNLRKTFGKKVAINDLSFKVKKGELFGFLGLNGAGKTTTLNIIMGLLSKNKGEITIDGLDIKHNINKVRNKIGIVFQDSLMDPTLSVYDNIYCRASLYNHINKKDIKQIVNDIIEEFELTDLKKRTYGSLSGGQRRRVDIARALVHKPEILFLDEPTTGLDPNSRVLVWDILNKIRKTRNLTILLTTHYMEEANECDYAIIIEKGNKLVEGTPAELKRIYAPARVKIYDDKNVMLEKVFEQYPNYTKDGNVYILDFKEYNDALKFVRKHNYILDDFELIKGTMDQVFLKVTGKEEK
ncbi:ABC transporter ATP-binding protein [Mycoplasma sp. Pen4]|uniref:ABC transporter ATP-binding protein n=1 Tax=Mycoplasma sp. Pen4 TaxID=640330 RepID=UPI0016543085|nr:ABC transporter ATP-binding protein [Mycoplasma sp. Pen4]QNM93544.1 ABC transporter ATP-binding protein [Mycoplasma sp. Pen4]